MRKRKLHINQEEEHEIVQELADLEIKFNSGYLIYNCDKKNYSRIIPD